MRGPILLLVAMTTVSARAQSPMDQGAAFFRSAWKRVQTEGPAAAEAVVRTAPARFKEVRGQVEGLSKNIRQWSKEKRLEERKNLVMELWRIRGSLDLMALLNPDLLQELTGIDAKGLRGLQKQVAELQLRLNKKP